MLFKYKSIDTTNIQHEGTVEAATVDAAISAVQHRGYTIVTIDPVEQNEGLLGFFNLEFSLFKGVSNKEVVILSQQISTLFEAQVSPLRMFRLLSAEVENKYLQQVLNRICEDLQGGSSISRALTEHPDVFSSFYVNIVRAGEESGSLEKSFSYLADYLDRSYEIVSKARNALIYPIFVMVIFAFVMGLMLTLVIPNIATILTESGQELPIYTKIVIGLSSFLTDNIGFIFFGIAILLVAFLRFKQTEVGKRSIDEIMISLPFLGDMQKKLLLTKVCDNLSTMLGSGISMVQAIEVTADVIDNRVYREILLSALSDVRGGRSFADAVAEYPEIPGIFSQMVKVGEETGGISKILTTLANFYRREVNNSVDTLISLIEPAMILALGFGVGILLVSVLMPIYNLTNAF